MPFRTHTRLMILLLLLFTAAFCEYDCTEDPYCTCCGGATDTSLCSTPPTTTSKATCIECLRGTAQNNTLTYCLPIMYPKESLIAIKKGLLTRAFDMIV